MVVGRSGAFSLNVPIYVAEVYKHGIDNVTVQDRMKAACSVLEILLRPGPVIRRSVRGIIITLPLVQFYGDMKYRICSDSG